MAFKPSRAELGDADSAKVSLTADSLFSQGCGYFLSFGVLLGLRLVKGNAHCGKDNRYAAEFSFAYNPIEQLVFQHHCYERRCECVG